MRRRARKKDERKKQTKKGELEKKIKKSESTQDEPEASLASNVVLFFQVQFLSETGWGRSATEPM